MRVLVVLYLWGTVLVIKYTWFVSFSKVRVPSVYLGSTGSFNKGLGMATDIEVDGRLLFPGGSQYERFMKVFHKVVNENEQKYRALGINPGDLGSHSARKGSCSFASAGSTVSPPMVSICLRAMWSMGPVKERYLFYEKAGDQYLGRVVAGLNVNDVNFAISPPHFDYTGEDKPEESKKEIENMLRPFLFGGRRVCARQFRVFFFFCLCLIPQ